MFKSNLLSDWEGAGRKRPHRPKPHYDPLLPVPEPPVHEPYTETRECGHCGSTHGCNCQEAYNREVRGGF